SVLRPRDPERRRGLRRGRRDGELLRRRAANVPLALQAVDRERGDDAGEEDGDDGESDQGAPHDGGSGYPAPVKVPRGYGAVSAAELVARSVACHVPGGRVSPSVPLTGWCPRSSVCGGATPLGSTRSTASASQGVPGSTACQVSVVPSSFAASCCGGAVSQCTTTRATPTAALG